MSRRAGVQQVLGAAAIVLAAFAGSPGPAVAASPAGPGQEAAFRRAAENGVRVEEVFRRTRRATHAWLAYADERTLLLPDILPGATRGPKGLHIYRPHNSGADNYPYLVPVPEALDWIETEKSLGESARATPSPVQGATSTRPTPTGNDVGERVTRIV